MNTPYGPAINLGTPDNPNFAGPAAAVGYARGLYDAREILDDLPLNTALLDARRALTERLEQ